MPEAIKISIITPSFNSGDYIERAIKSVLRQDYSHWEHIVVDGGSSDGTVEILSKYKHLIWKSGKDNGQADAMNKGFEQSSGDIIVYLNADDYFFPGAFSAVIDQFKKGAEFVLGNVLVKSPRLGTEFLNIPRATLEGMLRHWEPNAFCHNPVGYFYKREVQKACPFNQDNYASMDLEFLLDAASKFPLTKVDFTLGCFEDGIKTKTGVTQSKLDYWQSCTFPYLDKHLNIFSEEQRSAYLADRKNGYIALQEHMNSLNRDSFELLQANNLPMISIIIPSYNCGKYICRAINSLLNQGLQNLEIIIVDDASTDDTQEILKNSYPDIPFLKIIKHDQNQKLGASRNTGLDHARGKYIFFLDADDWIEKETIQHLVTIAEKYELEIVGCGVNTVNEKGDRKSYHAYNFGCLGGKEALSYLADYKIGSIVWDKLYLREFIENNHLRFVVPYWHEDVMFTVQAVYACKKFLSIGNLYYNYFQRDDSIVNKVPTLLHLRSYVRLYSNMIRFIEQTNLDADADGKELCRRLVTYHCTYELFPKLVNYVKTRSSEDWKTQCMAACSDELGIAGYALADFLILAMNEKSVAIPKNEFPALLETKTYYQRFKLQVLDVLLNKCRGVYYSIKYK